MYHKQGNIIDFECDDKMLIVTFKSDGKLHYFALTKYSMPYKYFLDVMSDIECGKNLDIQYDGKRDLSIYRNKLYQDGTRELDNYPDEYWDSLYKFLKTNWEFLSK
jgi:hypothetical protein